MGNIPSEVQPMWY